MKVVIIHGNMGCTSESFWIPWLKSRLRLELPRVEIKTPNMPDNWIGSEDIWIPYMRDELMCDEETVIIGYSTGAIDAMRYAEQHEILGSILVCPYHTDLNNNIEKLSGYFNRPFDWESIKENQQWIMQFSSTDDPYVPIEESRFIHNKLSTEYHEYNDRKHFMGMEEREILKFAANKLRIYALDNLSGIAILSVTDFKSDHLDRLREVIDHISEDMVKALKLTQDTDDMTNEKISSRLLAIERSLSDIETHKSNINMLLLQYGDL